MLKNASSNELNEVTPGVFVSQCEHSGHVVLLATKHCYCLPMLSGDNALELQDQKYQLESSVPLDAEEMSLAVIASAASPGQVADDSEAKNSVPVGRRLRELFRPSNGPQHAITVDGSAVQAALSANQIDLETVLAVMPLAMVAMQAAKKHESTFQLFLVGVAGVDLIKAINGKLQDWQWVSFERACQIASLGTREWADSRKLADNREWADNTEPCAVFIGNSGGPVRKQEELAAAFKASDIATRMIAVEEEDRVISDLHAGRTLPIVNLNNGPLAVVDASRPARRSQLLALCLALLVLLSTAGGLFWRGQNYRAQTLDLTEQQEEVYKDLFPKQRVPVGMMGRVESEYRKLKAVKSNKMQPKIPEVLPVMRAFWEGLPSDARFQISRLDFLGRSVRDLDGRAKTFEDYERFTNSLSEKGFSFPRTERRQTASGVTLTFTQIVWDDPLDMTTEEDRQDGR